MTALTKNSYQLIDIDRIKQDANSPQVLINLLNDKFPYISFKSVGATHRGIGKYSHLSIIRLSNGIWVLKDHKGTITSGDAWKVAKGLNSIDTKTKDGLEQICKILTLASGGQLAYLTSDENTTHKTNYVAPVKEKFLPNEGQILKQSYSIINDTFQSEIWKSVLSYFDTWGITKETLIRYNLKPLKQRTYLETEFTETFNGKDFAYTWTVKGINHTIKSKRPNAPRKDQKERYIQNTGNYIFGWEQLPKDLTNITLIIGAGEKDTLLINQHYNHLGIYAICFSSETKALDIDFINDLQSQCKGIYTLFDNDSTGEKAMKAAAIKNGIPAIKLNDYFQKNDKIYNDACDIIESHKNGKEVLEKIILSQIAIKTAIHKDPNDPFSIGVYDALKLNVKRYISENEVSEQTGQRPINTLLSFIEKYDSLLLQAAPGVGKSWGIIELVNLLFILTKSVKSNSLKGIERIIHTVPTGLLAEQIQADFKKVTGMYAPIIGEGFNAYGDIEKESYPFIISTFDSLPKVGGLLDTSLLTLDENHLTKDSADFRGNAVSNVFDLMPFANKCLLISATPLLELTTGIYEGFDFKLCKVTASEQQQIEIQPYIYTKGTQTDLHKHLHELTKDGEGKKIVRINDVKKLEVFSDLTNRYYNSNVSTIISSKEPRYKEDNPDYKSLVSTGKISKEFCFSTCLIDTGVSFKDRISSLVMFSPNNTNELYQYPTRARMDGQLNKIVNTITYHRATKKEAYRITEQFKNASEQPAQFGIDTLTNLKEAFRIAENNAKEANGYKSGITETQSKYFDSKQDIRYSIINAKYVPNVAYILHKEQNRINKLTDTFGMYRRLQKLYPNVTVNNPIIINPKKDKQAGELLTDIKTQRKVLKQRGLKLMRADKNTVLEIQLFKTKSKKERAAIMSELNYTVQPKDLTSKASSMLAANSKIFSLSVLDKPISKYLKLKSLNHSKLKNNEIFDLIERGSTHEYNVLYNSLVTLSELKTDNGNLSGKAISRKNISLKLKSAIQKRKDAVKKSGKKLMFSQTQLIKFVNDVTGAKSDNFNYSLMQVSELFEVNKRNVDFINKNDKRIRYIAYQIDTSHSMTSLIKSLEKYSVIRETDSRPNYGNETTPNIL